MNKSLFLGAALLLSACSSGSGSGAGNNKPNADMVGYWLDKDTAPAILAYEKSKDAKELCSLFVSQVEGRTRVDSSYNKIDSAGKFFMCNFDYGHGGSKELDSDCKEEGVVSGNSMKPKDAKANVSATAVIDGKDKMKVTVSADGQAQELTWHRISKDQAQFLNSFLSTCSK